MNRLTRGQCDKIAGGESMVLGEASAFDSWGGGGGGFESWGGGFDSWGGGFDSASIDFGTSVASGAASVWEGSGGFESGAGTSAWSLDAIGIEGGPMAVVRITAADAHSIPVFDNTAPVASYGPGEAPWEGQNLGQWTEAPPLSYAHSAFDGALIANAGRVGGSLAAAVIEGAITGAIVGAPTTPIGQVGTIVLGGLISAGTYYLLQDDHPTGHFESAPPKVGSNVPDHP